MQSPTFTLCQATNADVAALAELRVEAMRPSLEAIERFNPVRARARFLEGFNPAYTRKVQVGEGTVGFVVVRPVENHLLLDHLYIVPAKQCSGLGSAVLRLVIREAQAQEKVLRLGALKDSKSNEFYLRHGFTLERIEEWDNYYALAPSAA